MAATNKAFQDEIKAFKSLDKKYKDAKAFQEPMGADTGFPDFGFEFNINGRPIDVHIEYKNSYTAQMGSMRDWRFNGKEFYTPDKESNQKSELIFLMNSSPVAISNGKRILSDLKTYFNPNVKEISSSSLTVIKDKHSRRICLEKFAEKTQNYVIANLNDPSLGLHIIRHYKKKFENARRKRGSPPSVLGFLMKDEFWIIDTASVNSQELKDLSLRMESSAPFRKLNGIGARLEVRVQPRGLSSPLGPNMKPSSLDVMANFRLTGKPSAGTKIL